jgi:hypothetical protein
MEEENPYSAPSTNEPVALSSASVEFEEWEDKRVKKLYYRSSNIQCITALIFLGAILHGIYFFETEELVERLLFGGLVLLDLLSGVLLVRRTKSGRILGIIVCFLSLLAFPLGTLIGIVGLFAFFGAPQLFGPERIQHDILRAEFKQRRRVEKAAKRAAKTSKA